MELFEKLHPLLKHCLIAVFYISIGAVGKPGLELVTTSKVATVKVPIIVQNGKTGKFLADVEVKVINDNPFVPLRTNSEGYTEARVNKQGSIEVAIEKTGYLPKHETFNDTDLERLHSITLDVDEKAPSCFGDSCTGRIPTAANCNVDATTINYATGDQFLQSTGSSNVVRIELRSSQKCNGSWAKAVAPVDSIVYLQDDKGSKYNEYRVPKDVLPDHHTEMVSGELRLRACVQRSQQRQSSTCTMFIN